MGTISKITGIAIASVSKLGGIAVASITQMAGQVKAAAEAAAVSGPIPYSKSMYLDGSNDELRSYGNNALGVGGYENSLEQMENFAAPILDVTSPFSFDLEFGGTETKTYSSRCDSLYEHYLKKNILWSHNIFKKYK